MLTEAALLAVCAVFWVQTNTFDQDVPPGELGPAFFPRLLVILLAVCVLIRVLQTLLASRRDTSVTPSGQAAEGTHLLDDTSYNLSVGGERIEEGTIVEEDYPIDNFRLFIGCALAVGYVLGTTYLGYPLATLLVILAFLWTASKPTWVALLVAFATALAFPYMFVKIVFIALPTGVWIFDDFTVWLYNLLGIY